MLEESRECSNEENDDDDDDRVPLQSKLKDAIFSAVRLLEKEADDPLACMHDAGAICGGKYRDVHVREPWPQPIWVYAPHEVEQILLPDQANTLAVQAFLRMCGLSYQMEPRKNAEYMSPSGRVPFIRAGAFVLSDFENIVTYITNKGTNLSHNLTDHEKGDMRAYISLINHGLGNAEQYVCWMDPVTLNDVTKKRHGSVYPWPLNHIINWERERAVVKRLKVLGWANKTLDEIYAEVKMCCTALSERLDKKPYFYGEKASAVDALIFGHVRSITKYPFPTPAIRRLAAVIRGFPELLNHSYKILRCYFKHVDDRSVSDDFEFLSLDTTTSSSSSSSSSVSDASELSDNFLAENSFVFLHDNPDYPPIDTTE